MSETVVIMTPKGYGSHQAFHEHITWPEPPAELQLAEKELHVWRACLDLPAGCIDRLKGCLSHDEILRASRFRFQQDGNRFVAARAILRIRLGKYLGLEPDRIRFGYGVNGKPELHKSLQKSGIRFNLSHSEGMALYAFSMGEDVGVDIEYVRELAEMEQIVEHVAGDSECIRFHTLPASRKGEAFFTRWTRNEAFAKARGEGLPSVLEQGGVMVAGELPLASSSVVYDAQLAPWSMWDVQPAEGFAGAVVGAGRGWHLRLWQWPG